MELSCHYYISYQGEIIQLVQDKETAWHAGISAWKDIENLNHHSLGIEIGNPGEISKTPFTEAQYQALEFLLEKLMAAHSIPPENVLAHSDIATNRKKDPGKYFEWQRLEAKSLAAPFKPMQTEEPLDALYDYGYHGEEKDVIAAFQRRHMRNNVTGVLCDKTRAFICGE